MSSSANSKHEAWWAPSIFEMGIGPVIISRFRSGGARVESGVFLVDPYCLGVKDAWYRDGILSEYRSEFLPRYSESSPLEAIDPACARKLVESAVKYAENLGFAPHHGYKAACRVLGGIRPEECSREFVFGKDGKPFFVNGPNIGPEQSQRIIDHLNRRCGPGNFHFLIGGPAD